MEGGVSRHARYFALFHGFSIRLGHQLTTTPPPHAQATHIQKQQSHHPDTRTLTRRESNARTVPWWTVGVVLLKARAAVLALVRKVGRRFRASRESMVVMWWWCRLGCGGL